MSSGNLVGSIGQAPDQPLRIDAKIIEEPLEKLLAAAANKIEREWPASTSSLPSSRDYLRAFVLVCHNTFRAMRYLCADKPPDPSRKLAYANAARPQARLILEAIFNVIFMLEDLPARTARFEKSGWLSMKEDLDRLTQAYGDDPDWLSFLKKFGEHVERSKGILGVTPTEVADTKTIKYWPRLSGMRKEASPETAAYLQFLDDWFYKELSEDAHVKWLGLVRLGAGLMGDFGGRIDVDAGLARQKSETMATAIILLLVLLSELEVSLGLGLGPNLPYLWRIMREGFPTSRQIYRRRYDGKLV